MAGTLMLEFRKGEITPVIMEFRGENKFLSNFELAEIVWPAEKVMAWVKPDMNIWPPSDKRMLVEMPEMVFPASENAYMAWKTTHLEFRQRLQGMSPRQAKDFSQTKEFIATHRADYADDTRIAAMWRILRLKFAHPHLAEKLLQTGKATLIEGATWHDELFAFSMITGMGPNYLGRILMVVRDEVRVRAGLRPLFPPRALLPIGIR